MAIRMLTIEQAMQYCSQPIILPDCKNKTRWHLETAKLMPPKADVVARQIIADYYVWARRNSDYRQPNSQHWNGIVNTVAEAQLHMGCVASRVLMSPCVRSY